MSLKQNVLFKGNSYQPIQCFKNRDLGGWDYGLTLTKLCVESSDKKTKSSRLPLTTSECEASLGYMSQRWNQCLEEQRPMPLIPVFWRRICRRISQFKATLDLHSQTVFQKNRAARCGATLFNSNTWETESRRISEFEASQDCRVRSCFKVRSLPQHYPVLPSLTRTIGLERN